MKATNKFDFEQPAVSFGSSSQKLLGGKLPVRGIVCPNDVQYCYIALRMPLCLLNDAPSGNANDSSPIDFSVMCKSQRTNRPNPLTLFRGRCENITASHHEKEIPSCKPHGGLTGWGNGVATERNRYRAASGFQYITRLEKMHFAKQVSMCGGAAGCSCAFRPGRY